MLGKSWKVTGWKYSVQCATLIAFYRAYVKDKQMLKTMVAIAIFSLCFGSFSFAFDTPQYHRSRGEQPRDYPRIVGVECNKRTETLELGYFTERRLPSKRMDLWDTFDLKTNSKDGNYVESIHQIVRKCNLAGDQYVVKLRAVPGNMNLNGECGAATYGGAKVFKNGVKIFDAAFATCRSKETIVKVTISTASKAPVVTKMPTDEFESGGTKH